MQRGLSFFLFTLLLFAEEAGKGVEGEALRAANCEAFVVMLPRGNEEKLTASTSFHALTAGLGEVSEAVFLQDDEGKAFVESGTHDLLLAFGDTGRN